MGGFADIIIERRLNWHKKVRDAVDRALDGEHRGDMAHYIKKFMLCPDRVKLEDVPKKFIENAKSDEFFKGLKAQLEGKEVSWQSLSKIEKLFGVQHVEDITFYKMAAQVSSVIDGYFALQLEPLKGLPFFYTGKAGVEIDVNCAGTAQCVAVLHAMEKDISEISFVEVIYTTRLPAVLSMLNKLKKTGGMYVSIECDVFHGGFMREQLIPQLFDHALSLEDNTHVAVKNNKTGEVYDYPAPEKCTANVFDLTYPINTKNIEIPVAPEEKEGILLKMDAEKGLFLTALTNVAYLVCAYDTYGLYGQDILRFMHSFEKDYERSLAFLGALAHVQTNALHIVGKDELLKTIEKIFDIFATEDRVPARWLMVDAVLRGDRKRALKVAEIINARYGIGDVVSTLSERYFGNPEFFRAHTGLI